MSAALRVGKIFLAAALLVSPMAGAQLLTNYAGSGTGGYNGESPTFTALTAQLQNPGGAAVDAAGNLYIADTANNRIRKVTPAGAISTLLGTGASGNGLTQVNQPSGLAVDQGNGDIYVADTGNHRILRLAGGVLPAVVFAGTGTAGLGGDNIAATTSALSGPAGVAVFSNIVYVSDTVNNRVRKVVGGIVTNVAGMGGVPGACTATQLNFPAGIGVDAAGNLYIADSSNNRIMRVSGGVLSLFAGQSVASVCTIGVLDSQLNNPQWVVATQLGDVLIADAGNNKIKRVRAGTMTAVVGTGVAGSTGNNVSPTVAQINFPLGAAIGPPDSHIYYVSDTGGHRIRKIVPPAPPAPTLNSATPGSGSLTLAFTPVSTLDVPATSFTATCNPGSIQAQGTSSPIVVSGLTNGTSYSCTIVAHNGGGNSSNSNAVVAVAGVAPAITSAAPGGGTFGVPYTHTYTATGSPAPTFSVTTGAMPSGLLLGAGGGLAGTPTAAGTFSGVVTATNGVLPNATQAFSITIAKAAQAISFAPLPDRTIGTGPFTLSASGGASGNSVVFTSLTTGTCTATGTNGTTLTLIAIGTCTIAANQSGNANYDPASQVTQSFNVTSKIAQTIVFGTHPDVAVDSGPETLSATGGGSGNPVTFSSLTPSVCTTGGTNGATLTFVAVGTCTVAADQAGNATYEAAPQVTRSFNVLTPGRLVNISTRAQVLTGDKVMIGGFIIGGSSNKTVVVRARGPSLAPTGVVSPLANPELRLYSGQTQIAANDDWQSASNAAAVTASGFAPLDPAESAILITLAPGPYTAIVSGVNNTTGVGIIEVFEVDALNVPLINIATRGQVLTGQDVMIAGIVIQGNAAQSVVVRARGPSLIPGVPDALANPQLQLMRSSDGVQIGYNDNWGEASNAAALIASGFAPADPYEAAILVTLPPGAYTAIVTGVGATTGVAIVEVFKN